MEDFEKIVARLERDLAGAITGDYTEVEIMPAGRRHGLDYGPDLVQVVVLERDGDVVAYRRSNDVLDYPWQLGEIEDVARLVVESRSKIVESEDNKVNDL